MDVVRTIPITDGDLGTARPRTAEKPLEQAEPVSNKQETASGSSGSI